MSRGLHVALVTTFYPPHSFGGDGVWVRLLAHTLARHGHRVEVIFDADAHRVLDGSSELRDSEEPPGVVVHRLSSRMPRLSTLATQQVGHPVFHGRRIRRLLEEGDFDVIHYHNISMVGGPGVLRYGNAIKLYSPHEHWLVCPTHVLWRHGRELCTGRQCLRCVLHYRRPPQLWRATGLLRRNFAEIDAFCVPTEFTAQKHREMGFDHPVDHLPLFLPERDEDEADSPVVTDDGYFLYAGRLERFKGLEDVIEAFRGDGSMGELWIGGTGSHESKLRELAGNSSRIRFLGFVPSDRLAGLYRRARAVVVASQTYEISPMIVLEAFREGTPVIARALGPLPEMVEKTGGGLVFTDRRELTELLRRMADDAGLRARLGKGARAAFEKNWSEEVFLKRYFALITRLAERKGKGETLKRLGAPGRQPKPSLHLAQREKHQYELPLQASPQSYSRRRLR